VSGRWNASADAHFPDLLVGRPRSRATFERMFVYPGRQGFPAESRAVPLTDSHRSVIERRDIGR
jgi:hypothetical protein